MKKTLPMIYQEWLDNNPMGAMGETESKYMAYKSWRKEIILLNVINIYLCM